MRIVTLALVTLLAACSSREDTSTPTVQTESTSTALRGQYNAQSDSAIKAMLFLDDSHALLYWRDGGQRKAKYALGPGTITFTDVETKQVTQLGFHAGTTLGTKSLRVLDDSLTKNTGTQLVTPSQKPLLDDFSTSDDGGSTQYRQDDNPDKPTYCERSPIPGGGDVCFYPDPFDDLR